MKSEELLSQVEKYLSNPETKLKILQYLTSIDTFRSINQLFTLIEIFFHFEETLYLTAEHSHSLIRSYINKNPQEGELVRKRLIEFLLKLPAEVSTTQFTYIINNGYNETGYEFILTKYDIQEICYSRLKSYISKGNDIKTAYDLLYQCWKKIDQKTREVKLLDQALKLMNDFIKNHPCEFLENLIRPYSWPLNGTTFQQAFTLEPFCLQIFESWENFDFFLHNLKSDKRCSEKLINNILKIYEEFKNNGYKPINLWEYEFKNYGIDINKWK